MSETIPVGLILTAKDLASSVVRKLMGGMGGLNDATDQNAKVTSVAASKSRDFAMKLTGINQALELAKKAFHVFERAVKGMIEQSLAFRYSWDPTRKEVEKFGVEIERTVGRLGDLLMPIIIGLARSFTPLLEQFIKWTEENKKLIQQNMVTYFAEIATVLVNGMAAGAGIAMKAWYGLGIGVKGVQLAMMKLLLEYLRVKEVMPGVGVTDEQKALLGWLPGQIDKVSNGILALDKAINAKQTGIDEFQGKLVDAIAAAEEFGNRFTENAKRATVHTKELEAAMDAALKKLEEMSDAALKKLADKNLLDIKAELNPSRVTNQLHQIGEAWSRMAEHSENAGKLMEAAENRIFERAGEGLGPLLQAWQTFATMRAAAVIPNTEEIIAIEKRLTDETKQLAQKAAAEIVQVFDNLRQEISSVGSIETTTVQKIAIEGPEKIDRLTGQKARQVERYADRITKAEIDSLRRQGKEVNVITDTMEIKTKTALDAVVNTIDSFLGMVLNKLIDFMAQTVVQAFLDFIAKAATGGGGGGGGILGGIIGGIGDLLGLGGASDVTGGQLDTAMTHIGYASGGLVAGGVAGMDSVPAMLTPGEFVLPASVVKSIRDGSSPQAPGHYASGGMVPPAGSGGTTNINLLAFTTSRAQARKMERDVLGPERKRLERNRVYRGG